MRRFLPDNEEMLGVQNGTLRLLVQIIQDCYGSEH
jgi:hypothetical protein